MNVPKIRFKEFNDEYKKVKFGDIVNYQKGFAFKSKDYKNSGVRIIRISDTTNNSIKNDNAIYINKEEAVKHKNVELITDDIMISSVGSKPPLYDSMVGKVVLIPEFINGSLLNQNAIRFRTKQDNQKYIYNYLKQRKYTRFIENIMRGNANQRSITLEDLFEFELNIPSLNEQNKVSKLLSLLNKKIELQSKKIEDLKLFKKGLLIKEFNNKKCSNKLKECFDFGKAGGTPKSTNKDYYNGYIPFLSISDMTTQGKYIYYTDKSITEAGLNNSTAWLVPKNSIIISMYASYGLVSINKIDLTTSQAMFNMVINKNYVVEYIYYYLYYLYISNFYNSIVSTGTQSNLNAEQIKLLDIYIPCYNEQKRIYEQFSKIDFKINLEQKKINELLYLKKGLMQNMFV